MGSGSLGKNGRARTDSCGRTEGAVLSQVQWCMYGDDDVCVMEIAMQVGAGMQAGGRVTATARQRDGETNSGVSSRAGVKTKRRQVWK